jgi:hypothetical protein
MGTYASKEKLLLAHIPNIPYIDHHLTEAGNERVANLIFKHLQEKYD